MEDRKSRRQSKTILGYRRVSHSNASIQLGSLCLPVAVLPPARELLLGVGMGVQGHWHEAKTVYTQLAEIVETLRRRQKGATAILCVSSKRRHMDLKRKRRRDLF